MVDWNTSWQSDLIAWSTYQPLWWGYISIFFRLATSQKSSGWSLSTPRKPAAAQHTVTPQAVAVTNPCHIWICPPPTCPSIHFPFFQAPCLLMFFWYCYWRCWLRSKIMFIGNSEVLMLKLIVMRALKHPLLWQLLTSSFFLLNCSTIHQLLHSCSFKSPYTMSTFEDINQFVFLYITLLSCSIFTIHQ